MKRLNIIFIGVILLILLWVNGCAETKEPIIEEINEELIVQSDRGHITLWSSPSPSYGDMVGEIKHTYGGVKVTAFERLISSDGRITDYHIRTINGKEGWIGWFYIKEDVICIDDKDCEGVSGGISNDFCVGGLCVECRTTRDCNIDNICHPQLHLCVDCLSDKDCPYVYPKCDLKKYRCAECLTDEDCPPSDLSSEEKTKFCIIEGYWNKCVECLDNYDCPEDEWCNADDECIPR